MSETSTTYLEPFVPVSGRHHEVEELQDELFLDLHDGTGTQLLAGTCYGVAVKDCHRVGENHYILLVRPEMRALLYSQLCRSYQIFKLHRFRGDRESRMILTENIHVRFVRDATAKERREALEVYFTDLPGDGDLEDGIFTLGGKFAEDPLFVWKDLELDGAVLQASPVCLPVPTSLPGVERADLLIVT
jgi:hypothetical protein